MSNRNKPTVIQVLGRVFLILFSLTMILSLRSQTALAAGTITLEVHEYVAGAPTGSGPLITAFNYLVNVDNTGDPTDPLNLPSLTPMASNSPVVMTGDQTAATITLDDGRYLISVRADGYKLGGQHVLIPDDSGTVIVELVPEPLPLAKIRVHAFEDIFPTNGEDDIPRETGLEGFRIFVEDTAGQVVIDWWGNPICADYDTAGNYIPGTGGSCFTDANGDAVIPNLPRGKYEVLVLPPVGQESQWIQTTTIEGTKVIDAWLIEGDEGYSPREGFQQAAVWVGFVPPTDTWNDPADTGTILGTVKTIIEWTPPVNPLVLGPEVDRPWIAINDIGGTDQMVHLSRGNPDGSFQIDNVPDGTYQLAIWDEPLDYIIAFRTVIITGGNTVDLGEFGIPRWFGWSSGYVFLDENQDGIRDPAEVGLPGVELLMRFRDGSLRYTTLTLNDGYYEFPEVFELEKFYVSEVGFTNMGFTGALVNSEFLAYNASDPATYSAIPDALTVANLNWAAKRNIVDWGKYVYAPGENGGISGIVQYATTRNEFEARIQATEDYEPGIPDVLVRLYSLNPNYDPTALPGDPNADARGTLLNEVFSDHFTHPGGCDVTDSLGTPLADPLGLGPNCIEVPNISDEVKEGVFDGGYAFNTIFPDGYPNGAEVPISNGNYVIEVVPPTGYKIVTEEDLNTAEGNQYFFLVPAAACVGDLTLMDVPDEYGSPYDGQLMPLCDRKMATVGEGQNVGVDFYLMTDNAVPIPGRVFGFLLDDLNIETDPTKIYYGEKRGIPNAPVGVYDFTGRLITTVNSDENGIWEVLLPSTYAADCPIPSGVCPNVYKFVGNDPGTLQQPNSNYNPNYQTITFQFDVWPGKVTFADVALFSIVSSVEFPGLQSGQPAACQLGDAVPEIWFVSQPFGNTGDAITITGEKFGTAAGTVTLDGTAVPVSSWSDTEIVVTMAGVRPGARQLLVTTAAGTTSTTGITFHLIGRPFYNPRVVIVSQPVDPATAVIQPAIDSATGRTLVVVQPGTYYEAIDLNRGNVKLQGYGPGQPGLGTGGTILDQRFVIGGPNGLNIDGPPGGANRFTRQYNVQVDGFLITGSRDEQDIGGGIHVVDFARFLEISNNIIQSNGGLFGGGITLGEPYVGSNRNNRIHIHNNRILQNGGISLAGGIGIFNGARLYQIDHNQICGNYSAEYGGGISHFGLSDGGSIHHNEITYNHAFDEGGGIMIAGEQFFPNPEDPNEPAPTVTVGSGNVQIFNNLIQGNLSNDDGGGIRLLQPWDYSVDIFNNIIVNNVSTDMGAGISLDDASEVTVINNTIARNANTSTAEDSDFLAHAAGLVSELYSTAFSAYLDGLGATNTGFPDPVMFNNSFCENQAYVWDGVGLVFDSFMDLEVFSTGPEQHDPRSSLITDPTGYDPSNSLCGDLTTLYSEPFETTLDAVSFRQEPNFITVLIVTVDLPATALGDYHVLGGAAAIDAGLPSFGGESAPADDFDGDPRPLGAAFDIGADELGP